MVDLVMFFFWCFDGNIWKTYGKLGTKHLVIIRKVVRKNGQNMHDIWYHVVVYLLELS